jgi:hypothetical protein
VGRCTLTRQVVQANGLPIAQRQGTVQEVFKFPDIACKRVLLQPVTGLACQRHRWLSAVMANALHQRVDQSGQVITPLAQRGQMDFDDVEDMHRRRQYRAMISI